MCNINYLKSLFRICAKHVHDKDKAVQSDLCKLWIHMKCSNLNYSNYTYLQNCQESLYCIECYRAICTSTDSNIMQQKDLGNDHNSSLLLKPSPNLNVLVNQCNN